MTTRPQLGFTLLEMLVAIAIFAVFSIMAYGALMFLLDSRGQVKQEQNFWYDLTHTMDRIENDLGHARTRTIRDVDGSVLPVFLGQPTDNRVLGNLTFEFTRGGIAQVGENKSPDLLRVGYRLSEHHLIRVNWPVLDRSPTTKPVEHILLDNVTAFEARFYSKSSGWTHNWPLSNNENSILPTIIEITLTIENRGDFKRLLLINR
jgi:general secretion pathway protein J